MKCARYSCNDRKLEHNIGLDPDTNAFMYEVDALNNCEQLEVDNLINYLLHNNSALKDRVKIIIKNVMTYNSKFIQNKTNVSEKLKESQGRKFYHAMIFFGNSQEATMVTSAMSKTSA